MDRCEYLLDLLEARVPEAKAWRNQESFTVVLNRPPRTIIERWQLATKDAYSHVVVLPHVTIEKIDAFVKDLEAVRRLYGQPDAPLHIKSDSGASAVSTDGSSSGSDSLPSSVAQSPAAPYLDDAQAKMTALSLTPVTSNGAMMVAH